MYRGKVAMRISKGWVDLDGAGVALKSSLDILHLLEGVAHVGVGIGECRLDSDSFFVVHQSLV